MIAGDRKRQNVRISPRRLACWRRARSDDDVGSGEKAMSYSPGFPFERDVRARHCQGSSCADVVVPHCSRQSGSHRRIDHVSRGPPNRPFRRRPDIGSPAAWRRPVRQPAGVQCYWRCGCHSAAVDDAAALGRTPSHGARRTNLRLGKRVDEKQAAPPMPWISNLIPDRTVRRPELGFRRRSSR